MREGEPNKGIEYSEARKNIELIQQGLVKIDKEMERVGHYLKNVQETTGEDLPQIKEYFEKLKSNREDYIKVIEQLEELDKHYFEMASKVSPEQGN